VAVTVKVATAPGVTVTLAGWAVMTGAELELEEGAAGDGELDLLH
jgi:hypothetical protein